MFISELMLHDAPPAKPLVEAHVDPNPVEIALVEQPEFLITGNDWATQSIAGQIEIMAAFGAGDGIVIYEDMFDIIPVQSKNWIAGFQMMINDGSCWNTSGSVGRQAMKLIELGICLFGHQAHNDYYGNRVPARSEITDNSIGSCELVRKTMSQRYLDWIRNIR